MTTSILGEYGSHVENVVFELPNILLKHNVYETNQDSSSTEDIIDLINPFPCKIVVFVKSKKFNDWGKTEKINLVKHSIHNHILNNMINQVRLKNEWIEEGVSEPNVSCKNKTYNICIFLFNHYGIIPQRITASIEEGVFIQYLNVQNKKTLSIEIYNDLDVAALVNDIVKKHIILAANIRNMSFESVIKAFYE
jgi:hypothetical protein